MIQRLAAGTLGIAVVLTLAGMVQTTPQARQAPAPADKDGSKTRTDPSGPKLQGKTPEKDTAGTTKKKTIEKATFGGGCFWCMEAVFERVKGVKMVVSGYAGGNVPNPTYDLVCSGLTGHAEVVQITYDSSVVTYEKLLSIFWAAHDPTTLNRQEDDFGPNYRSIILYHNDEQKEAALKSYQDLTRRKVYRSPIVTELVPFNVFYPAEPYHQDYYRTHQGSEYSDIYIVPKLRKLRSKLR